MPLDRLRIQALCFDIDGTLRDTDDQWVETLAGYLRPVQRLLPRRDRYAFARWLVMKAEDPGNALQRLLDDLYLDQVFAALARRGHSTPDGGHLLVIPGIPEMLDRLRQRYPLAVVSARGQQKSLAFLDHHQLTPLFHTIVTGQTCRYNKPHPDPVFHAAQAMGVMAANCLMIGDTKVDILAGRAAGAQTVGVLCGFGEQDELERAGADLILKSTTELADYLLGPGATTLS